MCPVTRSGRYLVRGRLRVPFDGYERRPSVDPDEAGSISTFQGRGLTVQQAQRAQELLHRAQQMRGRLTGPRFAARVAGIVSAVKHGRVGNSRWGWSMHGKRGGNVMRNHAPHHLREISPLGARASVIARERRKARGAFDRNRALGAPLPTPPRPQSFLAL